MKSQNTALALLVSATLLIAGAGCKKTPKPPTLIPGSRPQVADGGGPIKPTELPTGPRTGTGPGTGGTLGNDGTTGRTLPTDGTTGSGLTTTTPINPEDASKPGGRPSGDLAENATLFKDDSVLFDYDRATVKASERPKLDRISTYLKSKPNVFLRVEGNCDERGTEDYNRSLGERRALSAREYLVNSGIAPERITTVTYGEDKPADMGHDESAWAKNRRADFIVLGDISTGIQ